MYEEQLQRLGLTSGEARVYIALIELGSSTVGPLVKKSKVAYSKIYDVLDRLIEKGLISYTIKEKTKYFQALKPTRLQEYVQKKEAELQQIKEQLSDMIPLLKNLSHRENEHEVEIFMGYKGILTAYDILLSRLQKGDTVRFFYVYDPLYAKEIFDFYFRSGVFFRKLEENYKKNNVRWHGIVNRKGPPSNISAHMPAFMQQKIVSFPIPGNMDIAADSVLITAWSKKPLAILITSKEVAENFRRYFEALWAIINREHLPSPSDQPKANKQKKTRRNN